MFQSKGKVMLHKEIWDTLKVVDVTDHIEKKGNLSYLSWAWAWGVMMEHYPNTVYDFQVNKLDDGTVEVTAHVTVRSGDETVCRFMWLPVMDYRNKAIAHPDAFAINTAKMRCLTKCFAMFGLGHYIYAGEDLPQDTSINDEQVKLLESKLEESKANVDKFLQVFKIKSLSDMPSKSFDNALNGLNKKIAQNESKQ